MGNAVVNTVAHIQHMPRTAPCKQGQPRRVWVKACRSEFVGSTSGVPQIS
jgi:hypothetical protein